MSVTILADALQDATRFFEQLPDVAIEAAYLAVNEGAGREGLTLVRRTMEAQIDFPKGYLSTERLGVRRKATRQTLEAVISGRDRPTSLARFAQGQNPVNTRGRGVRVTVRRGQTQTLRRAFLVNLKNNNLGLAIRLPAGTAPRNTEKAVNLGNNVYLLYGPSVDQVLMDVAEDTSPEIGNIVAAKFFRQFNRLARG